MDQHIVRNYFTTVCGCSGERSSSSPAVSGVPQGSAHGSLMVYDTSRCTVALFADDILMHSVHRGLWYDHMDNALTLSH